MWFNKKNKCEICGSENPQFFMGFKIIKSTCFKTTNEKIANFRISDTEYGFAFSELSPKHPEGHVYLYKLDIDNPFKSQICSLECGFNLCVKLNYLLFYPDVDKPGYTRGLSPDILTINRALGNPPEYKYRGQPGIKIG